MATVNEQLAQAVAGEDLQATLDALQAGADPNTRFEGLTPVLYIAARFGLVEIVKALLGAGADPGLTYGDLTPEMVAESELRSIPGHDMYAESYPQRLLAVLNLIRDFRTTGLLDRADAERREELESRGSKEDRVRYEDIHPDERYWVDGVLGADYRGEEEVRDWTKILDLSRVPKLLSNQQYAEAEKIVNDNLEKYTDYFFVHYWKGTLRQEQGAFSEAIDAYKYGIEQSKRTSPLYDGLGLAYLEKGDVQHAIASWCSTVLSAIQNAEEVMPGDVGKYFPVIAKHFGHEDLARNLGLANALLLLSPDEKQKLDEAVSNAVLKPEICKAIDYLLQRLSRIVEQSSLIRTD